MSQSASAGVGIGFEIEVVFDIGDELEQGNVGVVKIVERVAGLRVLLLVAAFQGWLIPLS